MRVRLIASILLLVVLSAPLFAQRTRRNRPSKPVPPAQSGQETKRDEPWQTNWRLYVAELSKNLEKGVDPGEYPRFKDKRVEFEGILKGAFDPAKPEEPLDIEMEPQQITIALKMFPGVDVAAAGNKTGTVTIRKILVKPAPSNSDAWKSLKVGDKVHYRATLGNDAVVLITTSDIGGLVLLFANSAEVLPAK